MVNLWVWGIFWYSSPWPCVKVTKHRTGTDFVHTIRLQPLVHLVYLPCHVCYLIMEGLCQNLLTNFLVKLQMGFFPIEHSICYILGMGWSRWCETKRKWVNRMLRWLGFLWHWHLTFNFKVKLYPGMGFLKFVISLHKWFGCHETKSKHIDWALSF